MDFFALIVAAVMKWDPAATEAQRKSVADHLELLAAINEACEPYSSHILLIVMLYCFNNIL